jgi:hypothetical protein
VIIGAPAALELAPRVATFFPIAHATHDTVVSDALPEIVAWMNQ